jgi:membrane fusion protein, multidrug efflux system
MKRLTPFLIFILVTGGLIVFINQDRIFGTAQGDGAQSAQGGSRRGGGGGNRRGGQVVPITAEAAKTANVPVYLSGVGTVQAYYTTTVRAQVSGRLTEVNYVEGQDVKAGDVLAKIDPVLFQAVYDQAVAQKAKDEALLANNLLDQKRFTDLVKTNSATQQQADTAVATVRQTQAQVKLDQATIDNAKANLDYCTIRAAITGRTGIRLVDPGNLVSSSDATGIVILTQLRPISVVFTLPENTIADILDAQSLGPVELQAVVAGSVIAEGKLLVVDNQIDQTTGTVKIKGTFANERNRLWPGQFVNVKLKLKVLENAIVVPSVAVQQGANGSYVYLMKPDNTVKFTNVKVTQEGEKQSVLAAGVAPGDTVVTGGFASLQDGTKVRLDTAPAPAAESSSTKQTDASGSGTRSDQVVGEAVAAEPAEGGQTGRKHRRRQDAATSPQSEGTKKP